MKKLDEVLNGNGFALYFGNRVLLPFKCDILKAVFENDIIMDFSHSNSGACYNKRDKFTEIYFHGVKDLEEKMSKYKGIRLVLVEDEEDIFDFSKHRKISLYLAGEHKMSIEEINGDILFFE